MSVFWSSPLQVCLKVTVAYTLSLMLIKQQKTKGKSLSALH